MPFEVTTSRPRLALHVISKHLAMELPTNHISQSIVQMCRDLDSEAVLIWFLEFFNALLRFARVVNIRFLFNVAVATTVDCPAKDARNRYQTSSLTTPG